MNFDTTDYLSNRNREEHCKDCIYYNYLLCPYIKVDGVCSIKGIQVKDDHI
jgi:hypothetical protein